MLRIRNFEIELLREEVFNSDTPIEVEIKSRHGLVSAEIAVLIEASIYHKRKFGELLVVHGFDDKMKTVLRVTKIMDLMEVR